MGGNARICLEPGGELRRVTDLTAVVGDQAVVGAAGDIAQGDRGAKPLQGRGDAEGEELERHRRAQRLDRLARVGDDDEALGRGRDDLLAQVGATAALDQPALGRHLVGAVDRDVEPLQLAELLDRDAELARLFLGGDRGGDAADVADAAGGDRRQQVSDGRSGAEPDSHPVLDQLRRRLGSDALLGVGVGHRPGLYARDEMDARIWLTGEGGEPRSVALTGERTVVGRNPEAEIKIDDEAVSWDHLEIENRGGVLMATDLDSRNGTALNGEPLERPRRLRDGDTLIVGGHRLEVSDPIPGRAGGTVAATGPGVALNEEERATAAALVAPYRSEGAFAGRPATRAEIAEALHVSERTAQRRLDALAAKLEVPGESGRERPRLIAARVIELGLDR